MIDCVGGPCLLNILTMAKKPKKIKNLNKKNTNKLSMQVLPSFFFETV